MNRLTNLAKHQTHNPATIKRRRKEAEIGIDPKYMHAAARRRCRLDSAMWRVLSDKWDSDNRFQPRVPKMIELTGETDA